jgi:hypothetical protein
MKDELYFQILDLPDEKPPADHYALLGVERLSDDIERIKACAFERARRAKLYQLNLGLQAQESARTVLREVAIASGVLLDPSRKADYDRSLGRQDLPASAAAVPAGRKPAAQMRAAAEPEVYGIAPLAPSAAPSQREPAAPVATSSTAPDHEDAGPAPAPPRPRAPEPTLKRRLAARAYWIPRLVALVVLVWVAYKVGGCVEWHLYHEDELRRAYFAAKDKPCGLTSSITQDRPTTKAADREVWYVVEHIPERHRNRALKFYLEHVPDGKHAALARQELEN